MIGRPNSWPRFAIFLAAHAAVLAGLATVVVGPAFGYLQAQQAEIEARRSSLLRQRASLAQSAVVAPRLQTRMNDAGSWFIQGTSTNLLNTDLLARLRTMADDRRIVLTSLATLPPRQWIGRQLVGAKVEFSGPSTQVADLLAEIEDGPLFLFIQRAHLTAAPAPDAANESITISLEIYGVSDWGPR